MTNLKRKEGSGLEILTLGIAILCLAFSFYLHYVVNISWDRIVRDANIVCNAPFFSGFLSNAGITFWFSTTSILILTGLIIRQNDYKEPYSFFIGMGVLTLMLGLDDLFMAHEIILPLHFGVAERTTVSIYAISSILLLGTFRKFIMTTRWLYLVLAITLFATSVTIDALKNQPPLWPVLEDFTKFLGIAFWSTYSWSCCISSLQSRHTRGGQINESKR